MLVSVHTKSICTQSKHPIESLLRRRAGSLLRQLFSTLLAVLLSDTNMNHVTMPASGEQRRFVLFGGQGSPTVFSDRTAATAEEDANSSSACSILLSKCHAAFLEDIASLDGRSQNLLAIDSSEFSCPRHLLKPPAPYHTHAVIQATTLYLCQVLHYLAESLRQYPNQSFQEVFDGLQETAGFSSGLLPATVVARSRSVDDFLANGVRGFRFAFWTAYHSRAWSREAEARADDVTSGDDPSSETTCSLVIRGLTPDQVEERLFRYAATKNAPQSRQLQISAISSQTVVSVSGPRGELSNFRAHAVKNVSTAFAHIHGWYHGGDRLEAAVPEFWRIYRRGPRLFPLVPIIASRCARPGTERFTLLPSLWGLPNGWYAICWYTAWTGAEPPVRSRKVSRPFWNGTRLQA